MVNANVVNARVACSNRADFCVFLLDSGRFMLFKNPVKYSPIFEINQEIACSEGAWKASVRNMRAISMRYALTVTQDFCAILLQNRETGLRASKQGPEGARRVNNGLQLSVKQRGAAGTGNLVTPPVGCGCGRRRAARPPAAARLKPRGPSHRPSRSARRRSSPAQSRA